jgi:predicted nucleotidyltransferase
MRLTQAQMTMIRRSVREVAGAEASVRVFGSRIDDEARGGDVDLLVDLPVPVAHPAELSARLSAMISREMHGRRVDVVVLAPNLARLPIHDVALREGQLL